MTSNYFGDFVDPFFWERGTPCRRTKMDKPKHADNATDVGTVAPPEFPHVIGS